MIIDVVLGIVCAFTPCPYAPQFPRAWRVEEYLQIAHADLAPLALRCELFGGQWSTTTERYYGDAPLLQQHLDRYDAAKKILWAWRQLSYITWPDCTEDQREECRLLLVEWWGEERVRAGVMPLPLSMAEGWR